MDAAGSGTCRAVLGRTVWRALSTETKAANQVIALHTQWTGADVSVRREL
jgi:hypothetical protein